MAHARSAGAVAALMLVATLAVLLCSSAAAQTPPKPDWPLQWSSPFGLNVENIIFHIKNRSSYFYYNWDIRATRIQYHNGCLPYITSKPCDLIFNPVGLYLLSPQAGKPCCLLLPGIGSVPPDFLGPYNFSGTEMAKDQSGRDVLCNKWTGPDQFAYWTAADDGRDIKFQDSLPTGITWNFGPISYTNQSASIFQLPSNCSASCLFDEPGKQLDTALLAEALHPSIRMSLLRGAMRKP